MQQDNPAKTNAVFPQHSLLKSIGLHVLPGALVTLTFFALKPLFDSSSYPPLLAFLLAIMLIDIPLLSGIMLFEGKKQNGRFSLSGVVLYREKLTLRPFAIVFVGTFVLLFLLITLALPINSFVTERLFSGLPDWWFLAEESQYDDYAKNALIIVFTFQLVLTGVALPWVEELYFRGYLLPRISRYGMWAPLIGGLLFGLYHSWQLFDLTGVFLLGLGLGYVVWWKQDIRLSISLHVFANTFARLALLGTAFVS